MSRLDEGVIDDLIPRTAEPQFWLVRVKAVLRNHRRACELDLLRETAALNAMTDRLTGVYNREAILATLFRETDRVQRMNGSLCMVLFDIDDFGHWNSRLGADACDDLLCQVAGRTTRLLRSYDLLGRTGKDEFLIALPGCGSASAAMLAERFRLEVFSLPFHVIGESVRLSACFGIASSQGRSPVVVLREAEQALQTAKTSGPESIQFFGEPAQPIPAPVAFLSPTSGDELLGLVAEGPVPQHRIGRPGFDFETWVPAGSNAAHPPAGSFFRPQLQKLLKHIVRKQLPLRGQPNRLAVEDQQPSLHQPRHGLHRRRHHRRPNSRSSAATSTPRIQPQAQKPGLLVLLCG